jgi:hypothetical protein
MYRVMFWPLVMVAAVLLGGCSEPMGTGSSGATESSSTVDIGHRKPVPPLLDSVRIPPSPIPPIVEELPSVESMP